MTLDLSGPQKRQLREALVEAFVTHAELARLTMDRLNLNIVKITGNVGTEEAAYDLIQWASARGLLAELIAAARNERPNNKEINALADLVTLTSTPSYYPDTNLQKHVNDNVIQLNPEEFREKQARAERRVCRIDYAGEGVGTGVLVGPDLVLTNHHVVADLIENPFERSKWSARFDHRIGADGKTLVAGTPIDFAENWNEDSSPSSRFDSQPDPKSGQPTNDELDYALIRLAQPVGKDDVGKKLDDKQEQWVREKRGWVVLRSIPITVEKHRMVVILQHPEGRPMKLSFGMAERLTLNPPENRVRHGIPTDPGSSGSPLFDQDWNMIALHHAGDPKRIKPEYNEAIPIALIAARPKVVAALPVPA